MSPKKKSLTLKDTQTKKTARSQTAQKKKAGKPKTIDQTIDQPMDVLLPILAEAFPDHPMADACQDPYQVLIGCIISLRTKDEVTIPACQRLFAKAATPQAMVRLDIETIRQLIYPAGFYKTKATTIQQASQVLLDEFDGQTPSTIDELLTLKGVGRKTANLVVGLGYGLPAICVDTHVHRISNRLGYVATKTPDETEMALRAKLPQELWSTINWVMVRHGQECCKPIGARCDVCPIEKYCPKIEVTPRKPPKPAKKLTGLTPSKPS
jgi:endonuclease-3